MAFSFKTLLEANACPHCKWYHLTTFTEISDNLCAWCTTMKKNQPQRFGRLVKSYGDYGELRRQKKAPNLEVFYIPVPVVKDSLRSEEVFRSVQNCSQEQLAEFTKKVGQHLTGGAVSQEVAEIVMDYCYAELNRRLNHVGT